MFVDGSGCGSNPPFSKIVYIFKASGCCSLFSNADGKYKGKLFPSYLCNNSVNLTVLTVLKHLIACSIVFHHLILALFKTFINLFSFILIFLYTFMSCIVNQGNIHHTFCPGDAYLCKKKTITKPLVIPY